MSDLTERLRAAAEEMAVLDRSLPGGPWTTEEDSTWGSSITAEHMSEFVVEDVPPEVATFFAALRPLAPVIASQLRQHAVMAADVVPSEAGRRWHITERCGYSLDPTEGQIGCDCFTDSIQLADAILGRTS